MGLTEEQKLRMEQKRAEAVAKMKSKSTSVQTQSTNQTTKATTDCSIKSAFYKNITPVDKCLNSRTKMMRKGIQHGNKYYVFTAKNRNFHSAVTKNPIREFNQGNTIRTEVVITLSVSECRERGEIMREKE